ncbi:hypothetical protein CDL15_Pgr019918 [Punica granatum]|uniref:Glycosyltransferase 61 catalytic domain-containing protein n=1 Tax=Punica granatum TaxID=22663 RepID=A0A218VQ22_PUNGR|nr:hypothetical protein CDL15_Pgr019918 [Punica granatum]
MTDETILARSFSRSDQRKLQYGAVFVCLLIALSISTALKPYMGPLASLNLRLSTGDGLKMLVVKESSYGQKHEAAATAKENVTKEVEQLCAIDPRSDYCAINGDLRIHVNSSTVFAATIPGMATFGNGSRAIRPYARKGDMTAMSNVREWTIIPPTDPRSIPQCTRNHSVPGMLFSTGGYSGNNFHDFSDIIVPLFLTSRQFSGQVQFLVTNYNSWWVRKFHVILESLSRYRLIDIDKEEAQVHCFTELIVGLKHHKELIIDPLRSPYSMKDFREFLRNAYSLKRSTAIKISDRKRNKRPRLLIVSRKRTRAFLNGAEIAQLAETLGYEVIMAEAVSNTSRNAEIVNSCDVMMGVHGAGLTNFLFLPQKPVLIQVVPLGGMEGHSKICFGDPARSMNMSYLEYRITERESSLMREYPPGHIVLKDPAAFHRSRWSVFKSVYLEKQNVELDLNRFRGTLLKALELLQA